MKKILLILFLLTALIKLSNSQLIINQFSGNDTLNGGKDTLSRLYSSTSNSLVGHPFNQYYRYTIACDSGNIQISHSASFPATDTWTIKQGESWTEPGYSNVSDFPNLYIRPKTGSLTPIQYRYYLGGQ